MILIFKIAFFVVAVAAVNAAEVSSVSEAWKVLGSPPPHTDILMTNEGPQALKILREHKTETERLVIGALRKGGSHDPAAGIATMVFDRPEFLRIVRTIIATYEVGDSATPFMGAIVAIGEARDMERLKQLVMLRPDSEGVIRQTALMADSENPYAHAALLELRATTPGKWQDSFDVQKMFAQHTSASPSAGNGRAVSKDGASVAQQNVASQPQRPAVLSPAVSSTASDAEVSNRWWIWGIGGVLAVALLTLIARKRR